MRSDKAPSNWPILDHYAVRRAMMVGKTTKVIHTTDTFKKITETINKIKTIEKTIPEGETVTKNVSNTIKSLEKIMSEALESRGMTKGESSAYLNRLKTSYAGGKISVGKPIEIIVVVVDHHQRS